MKYYHFMEIKVLSENTVGINGSEKCISEWGLSLYININGFTILLDTGQSDVYLKNAKSLGVDLNNVDLITLSHHHFDHVNGLRYFPYTTKKDLLVHSDLLGKLDKEIYEIVINKFNIIQSESIFEIHKGIYFLGSIPRKNSFEKGVHIDKDGVLDNMSDDSAIVFDSIDGLIIISGCSHAGICNICDYAKSKLNKNIRGVIGGFHLFKEDTESLEGTINYLKSENLEFLYPMHCVDFPTLVMLENKLGINKFCTGDTIKIV